MDSSGSCGAVARSLETQLTTRLQAMLYQRGIAALEAGDGLAAEGAFLKAGAYRDAPVLRFYADALQDVGRGDSVSLARALETLQDIPDSYQGLFAQEIAALRAELPERIVQRAEEEQIKEQEAARRKEEQLAQLRAMGIPYVGMSEEEVNSTRQLGEAGYKGTESEYVKDMEGNWDQRSWQVYLWYDTQGNKVFRAECRYGSVFSTEQYGGSRCWDGTRLLVSLGPFRPQTFSYSSNGDDVYTGDTGAGSGYSLREDYDTPEDLYEEGGYLDLDEAIDEWEEGL